MHQMFDLTPGHFAPSGPHAQYLISILSARLSGVARSVRMPSLAERPRRLDTSCSLWLAVKAKLKGIVRFACEWCGHCQEKQFTFGTGFLCVLMDPTQRLRRITGCGGIGLSVRPRGESGTEGSSCRASPPCGQRRSFTVDACAGKSAGINHNIRLCFLPPAVTLGIDEMTLRVAADQRCLCI